MEGLPITPKNEKSMCDDFSDSESDGVPSNYSTDPEDPYSSDLYESPDSGDFSESDSEEDDDDQEISSVDLVANPQAGAKDKLGKASGKQVVNGLAGQGIVETSVEESK